MLFGAVLANLPVALFSGSLPGFSQSVRSFVQTIKSCDPGLYSHLKTKLDLS